jgi:HEAT repeat protein
MHKCSIFVMMLAGIIVGIIFFLRKKTLTSAPHKRYGVLKRELFMSAAIVSSLLSYMWLSASNAMAKEKDDQTTQETLRATITNLDVLKQSKEWQDLKVLWNLITGDLEFLQDDSDEEEMSIGSGIPRWKVSLLVMAVDHRIKQLDRLVKQGVLSADTSKAIASLFHDMIAHVARSNSGATCYMMTAEGGRRVGAVSDLQTQLKEIRKQSKAGTLNASVVATIEKQLKEKLTVLDILGEWSNINVTEEEVDARIQQWRKTGKISSNWVDGSVRRQIKEAIVKERQSHLPVEQQARRKEAWAKDQQVVLDLTVDLGRHMPNRTAEKEIIKEFSGEIARNRLLDNLKTATNYEKQKLAEGISALGGTNAVPILMELLNDKTLECFSRTSSPNFDLDNMTGYVAYSVRDEAIDALKKLGVEVPEKSEKKANSPEARAMVKEALESKDIGILGSGIRAAGKTNDKSFIPTLKSILKQHPSLRDEILDVLGELGDASSLPLIIAAAEEGAEPWPVCSALNHLGTKEALEYLRKLVSASNDPSMRRLAINFLSEKRDAALAPVFKDALNDAQLAVRLEAASALQQLDCNDGFSVFVEASKSDDDELRNEAMRGLSQSKDPRAAEHLKASANPSDSETQNQAHLALIDKGGTDALKVLEEVLKGASAENKAQALRRIGLAEASIPGLEAVLIQVLTNKDEEIRSAAISALGQKGTTNAIPSLKTCKQSRVYELPEAIKAIRQRSSDQLLGSFLADLISADPLKRQEAEKRKNNLSFDEIQALIGIDNDYRKSDREQKESIILLNDLGARCIGPIIQSLSEMNSSDVHTNWRLMSILDAHMEEAIPQLMTFISDPNNYGRENIIAVFEGRMPRRIKYPLDKIAGLQELLTQCCTDKSDKVRAAARSLLTKMKISNDASLNTVLDGLNDPSLDVQRSTLLNLKYNDKPFTPEQRSKIAAVLVLLLKEKVESSPEETLEKFTIETVKEYAIEAMEVFPDKSAIPVLQKMIKQGEPEHDSLFNFRSRRDNFTPVQLAAKLLYSMSDEQTIPFWKEIASEDDAVLALWAHAALYKVNLDKEYNLKQLGSILRQTNKRSVRKTGHEIIKLLGDKQCVPILQEYLRSESEQTRKSIEPDPRTASSSAHNEERQETFKLMVDLGGKDVLEDVKRIFREDRDGYLRRDAVDYLISLAGQDAAPLLVQGLLDPSPGVRYHICEVIWITDGKDVIAALKKVAAEDPYNNKDEGYEVRKEADTALKKIELTKSGNVKARLIQEAKNIQSNLRYWAIERLGEIKDDPDVVEVLKELLKDNVKSSCCQDYHFREAAAEALRKLGKKVIDKGDNVFELQQ